MLNKLAKNLFGFANSVIIMEMKINTMRIRKYANIQIINLGGLVNVHAQFLKQYLIYVANTVVAVVVAIITNFAMIVILKILWEKEKIQKIKKLRGIKFLHNQLWELEKLKND